MAEFLTTTGVSFRLEEIIKRANERLILISPYFKMNARIRELLEDKNRLKIDIRVVHGKTDLHSSEHMWFDSLASVRVSFCENLHAKCYLNENDALLTSMNLYEFSQVHNHEMGILVSRSCDPALYRSILDESTRLLRISDDVRQRSGNLKLSRLSNFVKKGKERLETMIRTGYCIRCRSAIPLKFDIPYCETCYRNWNRYKNSSYKERYCHSCGSSQAATFSKPVCIKCYRKLNHT